MATRKLAKRLGLLRQRSQSSGSKKLVISDQIFSYLIVIDFESTCWREKNNYGQEIVEFPAVLLNTSTGEVESEFHTYVQPQEHPILSEFCTELTGITQMQVEAGIPLQICLSRFNRWLQNLQLEKGVTFPNKRQTCPVPLPSQKLCTFLTWSDWDLGVCLQYECKRKQLHKPDVLNNWIDLRSTYRLFYNRKPKGLNGALQDLGIQFSGREHSGLDDSRNTARLAVRMMRDGCVMKITRSLERTPVMVKAVFGSNVRPDESKKEKLNINKRETVLTTRNSFPLKDRQKVSCPESIPRGFDAKENSSSVQSLMSPKTLLNVMTAPPCGQNGRPDAVKASSTVPVNSSYILCSDTVSCFSNLPQPDWALQIGLLGEEEDDAERLVETEERCGSYDDVVLECDDALRDPDRQLDAEYISDFDSGCYEWEEPNHSRSPEGHVTLEDNLRETNNHRKQHVASKLKNTSEFLGKIFNCTTKTLERSATSESDACFAVPKAVNWSKLNQSKTGGIASPHLQSNLSGLHKNNQTNMFSPDHFKPFLPDKTSTPHTSSAKLKPVITKRTEPLKSSFTIYSESKKKASGSSHHNSFGPQQIPKVLSSLSTNSFCFNRSSVSFTTKGQQKITSPLCACGRRAKRQVVSNGGPNHGRGFFCCPVRRSGDRGNMGKGCEFFKWESALMKSSSFSCLIPQSDR